MPESVALTLESGQRLGDWSEVEFQFGLDCYSALSLGGPFDYERKEVRQALKPLTFPRVLVTVGDELVLTGRVKDVDPSVDANQASVAVSVYSLANDLSEVCAPPDLLPLEFSGLDLKQIASRMVPPSAGIKCAFDGPPGAKFSRIRCEPDGIVHEFLVDLALQRGFVLSDVPNGDLLFRSEAPTGKPVARLKGQPVRRVSAQFAPGRWFGTITGRASKKAGKTPARYTQKNPLYKGSSPRAYTLSVGDTEAADVPMMVKAAIGRMIASVATYTVEDLPGWRTPGGDLWKPNTTVTLTAPQAMIYEEYELLIRSVKLRQTAEAETATLTLVLPGTFGGKLPTRLPWD